MPWWLRWLDGQPGATRLSLKFFIRSHAWNSEASSPRLYETLSDEEIAAVLRQAIVRGGRLPRSADLYLAGVCAEHLVDELRTAGLDVVRRPVTASRG